MAKKILGIINFEGDTAAVDGLGKHRPVPAIAFLGRYRIIDFVLSNMTNSGIERVQVYCKEKPRNLIEHLGNGTHYNINSKRGKLRILYGEKEFASPVYNTDVANFNLNMQYIEENSAEYVVVAPSYFIYSLDFAKVVEEHEASGADVTVLYTDTKAAKDQFLACDLLTMDGQGRVTAIEANRGRQENASVSMECYVLTKDLFIEMVKDAADVSSLYWFKDILRDSVSSKKILGYGIEGYVACINTLKDYFRVSMELRDRTAAEGLFKPGWPIYTHTNDSQPSKYTETSRVTGSVVANGCVIEGTVRDSIISRGVTIGKGAVVTNCIILPGASIAENAKLDHVVVDKYAKVHIVKELIGTADNPVYVNRRDKV